MSLHCFLLLVSMCAAMHNKPVVILSAIQTSVSLADSIQTEKAAYKNPAFQEEDPLAVPLVKNPPLLYAVDVLGGIGTAWLGNKMRTSSHRWERKLWWLPSVVVISGNTAGIVYSTSHSLRQNRPPFHLLK